MPGASEPELIIRLMQTCHFCPKFWTIECLCVSACESLTKLAFLPPNFVGQSESWNRTLLGIWLAGVSPDSPWACISQSYIDIKYLLNSDWLRKSGVFAPKFDNQIGDRRFMQFWPVRACEQCLCVRMTIEVTGFLYVCFFLNPVYYTYYHIRINPFGKSPVWFLAVRHLGQKC